MRGQSAWVLLNRFTVRIMADTYNAPKLPGFGVANYLSFGSEGFIVEHPKKINVFIGKNNCGKSNVLKGIALLKHVRNVNQAVKIDEVSESHRRSKIAPSVTVIKPTEQLLANAVRTIPDGNVRELMNRLGKSIIIRWKLDGSGLDGPHPFASLNDYLPYIHEWLTGNRMSTSNRDSQPYLKDLAAFLVKGAIEDIRAFDSVLSIPVFREIKTKPSQLEKDDPHTFNGNNIINSLKEMREPVIGHQDQDQMGIFRKIELFICDLLRTTITLTIPYTANQLIVNMHGNRYTLDSYGTGVHHLVILCAALAMNSGKVVTIEEPEIHLHPELQRKLLQFISTKTENTYFITTHSNVFLDSRPDVNVYHVLYSGEKSSVLHLETTAKSRDVLADMGYKASDLLQSNCIIWVEGPSDRLYLNKWLRIMAPDLLEGIHYSIAFYGGKVLPHFTADDDPIDDLIEVLRINKNAIFVMDRDGDTEEASLADYKSRIQGELKDRACWITEGREIENYLDSKLIVRVLLDKYPAIKDLSFSLNDKLGVKLKENGGPKKYDKVASAREFCQNMTVEDMNCLDLKERLRDVIGLIYKWNQMEAPQSMEITDVI